MVVTIAIFFYPHNKSKSTIHFQYGYTGQLPTHNCQWVTCATMNDILLEKCSVLF